MHLWIMFLVKCTCSASSETSLTRGESAQYNASSVPRVWGCACLALLTDTSPTTKKESSSQPREGTIKSLVITTSVMDPVGRRGFRRSP
jgi:hypothetical protein